MPSLVTLPLIQCHQTSGRACLGGLEKPPEGATLETEKTSLPDGEKTIRFLKAPVAQRGAFEKLGDAAGGARVLSGLLFEEGKPSSARSYLVQPDRTVRGEFVQTAKRGKGFASQRRQRRDSGGSV